MIELYIMCGLPGSGKTTWVNKNYKNYTNKNYTSTYILSNDDYWVRPDGTYDYNFKTLDKCIEWSRKRYKETLISVKDLYKSLTFNTAIYLDNTFLIKAHRKEAINTFKSYFPQGKVTCIYFEPSSNIEDHLRGLHLKDLDLLKKKLKNFERPTIDEGFDEIKVTPFQK